MLKTLISVHLCIQRQLGLNFFSETRCLQASSECTDCSTTSLSWAQVPAQPKKLGALREEAAKCNNLVIAQKTQFPVLELGEGWKRTAVMNPEQCLSPNTTVRKAHHQETKSFPGN